MTLKFPTQDEFESLLTRSGVLPNTVPDNEDDISDKIQSIFQLTMNSDQLKLMIEDYLRTHMAPPQEKADDPEAPSNAELNAASKFLGESVLILYSQAMLIGMLMFEMMLARGMRDV